MPRVLYLDCAAVEALLPLAECVEVMAATLAELGRGEAQQPLRSALWLPDRRGLLGMLPAAIPARGACAGGLEPQDPDGLPRQLAEGRGDPFGFVLLFEAEAGRPLVLLDVAAITAIRIATAVSPVTTRLLAREDAGDLALLGSLPAATSTPSRRAPQCLRARRRGDPPRPRLRRPTGVGVERGRRPAHSQAAR
jgi:ornithine cyclodeaminase